MNLSRTSRRMGLNFHAYKEEGQGGVVALVVATAGCRGGGREEGEEEQEGS